MSDLERRAALHAALGDPLRLAIVEQLIYSDASVSEVRTNLDIAGNLLAHHLDVLERAGLIERRPSSGDHRRRYLHAVWPVAASIGTEPTAPPVDEPLFVCTHNSARSQIAMALWRSRTGRPASSAGTRPAPSVHPLAVAAARRAGLDLGGATTTQLEPHGLAGRFVITVCDQAHEELSPGTSSLHWSVPDPVERGGRHAFDAALAELDRRVAILAT